MLHVDQSGWKSSFRAAVSGFEVHLPVYRPRASGGLEPSGEVMPGTVVSGGVFHKLASDLTALSAVFGKQRDAGLHHKTL